MKCKTNLSSGVAAIVAAMALGTSSWAATTVQVGSSGKTYASSVVSCAADTTTGELSPVVDAGLFNPKNNALGSVSLNGAFVATVTAADPVAKVWLADNTNTVVVALNKKDG